MVPLLPPPAWFPGRSTSLLPSSALQTRFTCSPLAMSVQQWLNCTTKPTVQVCAWWTRLVWTLASITCWLCSSSMTSTARGEKYVEFDHTTSLWISRTHCTRCRSLRLSLGAGVSLTTSLPTTHSSTNSGVSFLGYHHVCTWFSQSLFSSTTTSWSPIGVLLASQSDARYIHKGQLMTIPQGSLMHSVESKNIFPDFSEPLEGYPNRDSVKYLDVYGIPEASTVIRGTLRYKVLYTSGYASQVLL